jgi:hypothetical protein
MNLEAVSVSLVHSQREVLQPKSWRLVPHQPPEKLGQRCLSTVIPTNDYGGLLVETKFHLLQEAEVPDGNPA